MYFQYPQAAKDEANSTLNHQKSLLFNVAYKELEEYLNAYLEQKKQKGWSKIVSCFKKDQFLTLAHGDIYTLQIKTKELYTKLNSKFAWLPCAQGSTLKAQLVGFYNKNELALQRLNSSQTQEGRRSSLPILISPSHADRDSEMEDLSLSRTPRVSFAFTPSTTPSAPLEPTLISTPSTRQCTPKYERNDP